MAEEVSSPSSFRTPSSTYRLQLNRNFTFGDAENVVPYLTRLGVSDLYASPYLRARPGSLHGYDISDHTQFNPEIGSEEDHTSLVGTLREHGMGLMLDIVPNHMGIGEPTNLWWMDLLENGQGSLYAKYFDVDWEPLTSELAGKVLLPVLGDQFGVILERGELKLAFTDGRFRVEYFDNFYPIAPRPSSLVLRSVLQKMKDTVDEEARTELESIVTALELLPGREKTDEASISGRRRESQVSRRRLAALHESSAAFRTALAGAIEEFNGVVGEPHSFDLLAELLEDQAYRLAYWRVASDEINYRRFFDINDLAGIRVERGEVFQATHKLIFRLVAEGGVTALRVDHPDGLYDPYEYLRHLRSEAERHTGGEPIYIVVEKILTENEALSKEWPVAGTVGYDFLNRVNGLFVAAENATAIKNVFSRFIDRRVDFDYLSYEKKKLILRVALASELNVLAYHLNHISEQNRRFRDFTLGSLTDALRETIACFPVYRTYVDAPAGRVHDADREYVERAINAAMRRNRATSPTIFEFIRNILLLNWQDDLDTDAREEHALFVMKFQQLTGPVMAKGVEDTSFYIDNRLVSLNEVGGSPAVFGTEPDQFHDWLAARARDWPFAMNNSTTHDTKRSEDVRARINVLSEIPDEWETRLHRWATLNAGHKKLVDGDAVPDLNEEYLLYQTLVGIWPSPGMYPGSDLRERIMTYMKKATHEAKVHTSWINPNVEFDAALRAFISEILENSGFIDDFAEFQAGIAEDGMINSLSQTLIKLMAPGVPDMYQGEELWDFSLVDPDNRRPVDFCRRIDLLKVLGERLECEDRASLAAELLTQWSDGRIKMFATHLSLRLRKASPELLAVGEYVPLRGEGAAAGHVFAFGRVLRDTAVIVAVPRLVRTFRGQAGFSITDSEAWGETRILLPGDFPGETYRNVFTGAEVLPDNAVEGRSLQVGPLLDGFPVCLLETSRYRQGSGSN